MKTFTMINKLYLLVFLTFFIGACATTQEEEIEADDSSVDIMIEGDGTGTMLEDDEGITTIAIIDEDMTAEQLLEQTDTDLANRTIYFEFDSAKLSDESLGVLEVHGNFIAENANVEVRLEGHTDERGSREYNIGLGERRSQAVRQILMIQGVRASQVSTVSFGEERPAAFGSSESDFAQNRRVEITYTN